MPGFCLKTGEEISKLMIKQLRTLRALPEMELEAREKKEKRR